VTTTTITFRVDAAEHDEIAARAERDKVSLSDYVRVRLGLRGEGQQNGRDSETPTGTDHGAMQAQLDEHDRRLDALEADRAITAG
jgi:mobilization protein NikA